ncbi:unnamed protein product [Colias eurytheme]|nr:unnamed protein product [Colias eurytheme]
MEGYTRLYASHAPQPRSTSQDPRATLIRHYTEELPDIRTGACENFMKPTNQNRNHFKQYPYLDDSRVVLSQTNDGADYINANYEDKIVSESNYTETVLNIINKKTGELRIVHHFKFLDWPEGQITAVDKLLDFLLAVNEENNEFFVVAAYHNRQLPGPIVVHGSKGIGRTSIFCAIDTCLYQLVATTTISVPSVVLRIRHQRCSSHATLNQYTFIYTVLHYFLNAIRSNYALLVICFYLPYQLWKVCEGGRRKMLAVNLTTSVLSECIEKSTDLLIEYWEKQLHSHYRYYYSSRRLSCTHHYKKLRRTTFCQGRPTSICKTCDKKELLARKRVKELQRVLLPDAPPRKRRTL